METTELNNNKYYNQPILKILNNIIDLSIWIL